MMEYKSGVEVNVKSNTKVYPTYDSKENSEVINGVYFLYDDKIRKDRIRVTDSKDKVGKPCSITGWININDIIVEEN